MSRQELETYWTLMDVLLAHLTLDAYEEAEERAARDAQRAQRARGGGW